MKKNRTIFIDIAIVFLLAIIVFFIFKLVKGNIDKGKQIAQDNSGSENVEAIDIKSSSISNDAKSSATISDVQNSSENFSTDKSDESTIKINNGGELNLDNSTVSKNGDSSDLDNSLLYGVNSAILATDSGRATIKNTNISSDAKGASGLYSTGVGSQILVSDSIINTSGSGNSRGLNASYGGHIETDNTQINTYGDNSAALGTSSNNGIIIVNYSKLSTNGSNSPLIYSKGSISLYNSEGISYNSQIGVIEGNHNITITKSNLLGSGKGSRNDLDNCGFMFFSNYSSDKDAGPSIFTATNSTLGIKTDSDYYSLAPMFLATNGSSYINLTNNTFNYGSNVLVRAIGVSGIGSEKDNGSNVILNAKNQELKGNIEVDGKSSISISLTEGSLLEGTINGDKGSDNVSLVLDSSSFVTLTGDSYVKELNNEMITNNNINFNGYTLYVNGNPVN